MKPRAPSAGFKKPYIPWYDTQALCLSAIAVLFVVLLFGVIGIWVARENPLYHDYTWVPVLLVFLCSVAIVSITVRLTLRSIARLLR